MDNSEPFFEGVFCPSITITDSTGAIDYDLWGRHIDHLIDSGINGILLFGSIGEFYAFPREIKQQAIAFAVRRAAGRIPILAGIGGTDMDEVLAFARSAENSGVGALVVVSPYYFGPSAETARRYYGIIAENTALPIILYNFPARTGNDLTPTLVAQLAADHANIVGIKDTVDTISHTRKVIAAARTVNPRFAVLSGFDEYYMVNRVSGGNGVLCGLTNVKPEIFVTMHRSYQSGEFTQALQAAKRISHLMAIYDCADLFISAIKGAVRAKGLAIDTDVREPARQLSATELSTITALLR